MAQISVIIPTLNAAQCVSETLESVDIPSLVVERLVVDGGSDEETRSVATAAGARIIEGHQRGRGMQLAAGAAAAQGGWLLFLHADTVLQDGWATEAERFVVQQGAGNCAAAFRFGL
ncbi:MAG: glycosyltransferase, partial [Rhodospirillaceae bacterium]|nr:glycosyltransferase [Rhodospirillaceae bacterium]